MNYKSIAEQIGPRTGATQEWVFRVLRQGIVSGELPGGTQLNQDEISAALNVSHIPVREALRQLEAQGLVRIHPNRGASVTQLSRRTLLDMMEVRATLSVTALRNSAPLLTEEDYRALDEVIAAQKRETDLYRTEELNYRFHELLSYHAENSISDLLMEIIHANIDRYLRKNFYGGAATRARSIGEHEQIVAACRAGEYDRACDLLRDHILNAKDYIPSGLEP